MKDDLNIDLWNIWDLHIHSPRSFDYLNRTCDKSIIDLIDKKEFEKIKNNWIKKLISNIEKNQIKLFSITDHNLFDKNYYESIKSLINQNVTIIPGIEVDCFLLKENKKDIFNNYFQLLIHINPNDYEKLINFNDFFCKNSSNNKKNYKINFSALTFEQVCSFFTEHEVECNISV